MRYSYAGDGKKNSDDNFTDIKICAWNIEGLTADKLMDDILGNFLLVFHILLLTETWACKVDNFCIPGYIYIY